MIFRSELVKELPKFLFDVPVVDYPLTVYLASNTGREYLIDVYKAFRKYIEPIFDSDRKGGIKYSSDISKIKEMLGYHLIGTLRE